MNKLFATSVMILPLALLNVLPIQARSIVVETEECVQAIASVENQLVTDRQLKIEMSEISDRNISGIPPKGRPHQYAFGISGKAVEAVMNSPVLLDNLATQIIDNCSSVSSISFGQWRTGWFWVFGLMPNGEVEMFSCPEDHFHGGGYRDLVWGESCPV